jgi:hypothetical protein
MAGYTRQSSYTDGDVITAAHSNDEFNQVLAAFVNTTGHKHDGTAAEGPVIGLIGDPGETTPLNKVVVDNTNNRVGVFVDAGGAGSSVEQLRFQDGAIVPVTNNDVDLGTSSLEFKDAFFDGTVTTDALAAGTANIDGGSIDGATLGTNSAITQAVIDNVNINGATIGHTDDTDLITLADGIATVAGEISVTTLDIGGTNVTATAAELNIMDGGTSASGTTVADGDRVVFNDDGTMKQVAVTDLAAYFDDEITAMPNLVTTAATTVGALNSGSITSGFGTIDTGSSTITTTGLITGGSLDIDDVVINGSTIGHTDDTDLITVADGIATVAGEVSMTTLDIGGTNVTATAAELNLMDGGTSAGTTAVAGSDGIVTNDAGTMRQTTVDTFDTYLAATSKTLTNKTIDADNNTLSNIEVDNLKSGVLDTDLSSVAGTDTTLASAKAIKAYVDAQLTASDLDFQGDSGGALSIDLDSETLDIAGGTGIDTSGSGNTLTVAIDSTVATLSGSQTLTNKTIDASQLSGTVANARLDADLQALAGLTSAADKGIQFTGSGSAATYDLTAAGKALLDDADAAAQRTTLGLGTAAVAATGISNGNVAVFTSGAADNDFLRIDGTSIEGRSASEVLSDIGGQASLTFGISNTNAVKIDSSSVADDEFARFTANGLESRSASEVRSDIGLGTAAVTDTGISNGNVAVFTSGVADDDFLRVNGTSIEGRSASEVATDIGAATAGFAVAMAIAL